MADIQQEILRVLKSINTEIMEMRKETRRNLESIARRLDAAFRDPNDALHVRVVNHRQTMNITMTTDQFEAMLREAFTIGMIRGIEHPNVDDIQHLSIAYAYAAGSKLVAEQRVVEGQELQPIREGICTYCRSYMHSECADPACTCRAQGDRPRECILHPILDRCRKMES